MGRGLLQVAKNSRLRPFSTAPPACGCAARDLGCHVLQARGMSWAAIPTNAGLIIY